NNPTRAAPSSYDVNYEFGYTQPLLAGFGTDFTRIAGPLLAGGGQALGGGGVLTARINEDISLTDFERAMRDMVFGVENAYWDLYVAYRTFASIRAGRDSALDNWRRIMALREAGALGGEAIFLAQARTQYYQFAG